ncbi:hypothetical protein IFR05_013629 [Cadophora sp. M221]|nr:hypothetical protein IFR05_013629 [Cadophora sp. M221]
MFSLKTLLTGAAILTNVLAIAPEPNAGFRISWSDDFTSSTLDPAKWDRFTGTPSNNEQQSYLKDSNNCQITPDHTLLITPENDNGKWTSCRIESVPNFETKPGGQMIVQARLKLGDPGAKLQGIWPAFWSLGEAVRNGVDWPGCGEIDTMENINGDSLGHGTIHCGAACNDPTGLGQGMVFDYGTFHTWAHAIDLRSGDWREQSITWYMDGQPFKVQHGRDVGDEGAWKSIAQKGMFITLNVAVGGSWPGNVGADTASGKAAGMEVQYVAVYESE